MDNRFRPLRAVVFVLTCLALLAFTYLLVFRVDFGGSTAVTVRFDAVGTIQPGSPVRQSGVKVGTVSKVTLAADDRRKVDVELSLYRGLDVRIDDRIAIVTGGLLGDQYIDIAAGSPDSPLVGPGQRIDGHSGLDLKVLVDGGGSLIQDLGTTTRSLAAFLDSHSDQLDRILDEAERGVVSAANAAERADHLLERADRLLTQVEGAWEPSLQDVKATLQTLKQTSSSLQRLVDGLATPGAAASLLSSPAAGRQASETLENLRQASQSLKSVTDQLEAALQ